MDNIVEIYTDGACSGNPGPGGWGVVLIYGSNVKEIYGSEKDTTNNKMELYAAIQGLLSLKKACEVELYTDSNYLKEGITVWIKNWKLNNWKTSQKKPVKNVELWQKLDELIKIHNVNWHWVKAHNGNLYNEKADKLAVKGREEAKLSSVTTIL
ncbi:MAG: ribonuclease HI [Alphaproteobacteria bacterium]